MSASSGQDPKDELACDIGEDDLYAIQRIASSPNDLRSILRSIDMTPEECQELLALHGSSLPGNLKLELGLALKRLQATEPRSTAIRAQATIPRAPVRDRPTPVMFVYEGSFGLDEIPYRQREGRRLRRHITFIASEDELDVAKPQGTFNKSVLVAYVADELRTSKLQASLLVETVLDGVRRGLQDEGSISLTGFGVLHYHTREAIERSISLQQPGNEAEDDDDVGPARGGALESTQSDS